ncbi:MAG: glycosyltransferase family 4 protein [Ignavibacteria bacterium]|nr:glycosyltransferase family 4 protein [Ignavibacteria bacterium]
MIFFLSHPIQYFSPMLKLLAKQTHVKVYYYSDISLRGGHDEGFGQNVKWDVPLLEGYEHEFIKNLSASPSMNNRFTDAVNPGIVNVLRKEPDKIVVLNGWSYFSDWIVMLAARFAGKKIWLRCESPINQEIRKSGIKKYIKDILLRHIIFRHLINKFLYIGTRNKEFYAYYGVNDTQRLIFTPYSVDNHNLQSYYRTNITHKQHLRQRFGVPSDDMKVILFVGKYISKKRPMDLLKAFSLLPTDKYFLIMVGEGNLRTEMEAFIREKNMKNTLLTGFVNQSSIWDYYIAADTFVMCSGAGETWGLTVNEAMNFQLPVIVSDTCGCSADLVEHEVNGYVFNEGDIAGLAKYILKTTDNNDISKKMGAYSLRIIERYSNEVIAANLSRAVVSV